MSNAFQMVNVDSMKMMAEFEKRMIVPTEAAREIGIHDAYLSKTFSRGRCNCKVVLMLQEKFGIDPETYVDPDMLWKVKRARQFEEERKAISSAKPETEEAQPKEKINDELYTVIYEAVYAAIKKVTEEQKGEKT